MPDFKRLGSGSDKKYKTKPGATGTSTNNVPAKEKRNECPDAFDRALKSDDRSFRSKDSRNKAAMENALSRPREERELAYRPDRIKKYLTKRLNEFIFDEFSDTYLKRSKLTDIMKGVPVPLRKEDLELFKSEKGLGIRIIGENMARVIGVDPKFKHTKAYINYLERIIGKKPCDIFAKEGRREATNEDYETAMIHFRAGLVVSPIDMACMYGYARTCRALYSRSSDENYIGDFKAEAFEYFEMLTELYPKYAYGWYYLGYMYMNMGLYQKAHLAWESFLPLPRSDSKDRKEIRNRMKQIKIPMQIEKGYNAILAGRWQEGLTILEPFTDSAYKEWWPLWYYLGEGYLNTGRSEEAKEAFIEALRFNASHIDSMRELVAIYETQGDAKMVKKYKDKIELVQKK